MNNLWKTSVNKAFYGFLAYTLLSGIIASIASWADSASSIASFASGKADVSLFDFSTIVNILAIVGFVYYFLGIKGMRDSAASTPLAEGTAQMYTGTLIGLIGTIVSIIPFLGFIGAIVSLVGFVFMMLGVSKIKKLKELNALAAKGAGQLFIMMILQIVSFVIDIIMIIPFLGEVICFILSIVIFIYAFLGWKNFSNSELPQA